MLVKINTRPDSNYKAIILSLIAGLLIYLFIITIQTLLTIHPGTVEARPKARGAIVSMADHLGLEQDGWNGQGLINAILLSEVRMLTDMNVICHRISRGNGPLSIRVLLTALIKGNDEIRTRIITETQPEDFNLHPFGMIFQWIVESLESTGQESLFCIIQNPIASPDKHGSAARF